MGWVSWVLFRYCSEWLVRLVLLPESFTNVGLPLRRSKCWLSERLGRVLSGVVRHSPKRPVVAVIVSQEVGYWQDGKSSRKLWGKAVALATLKSRNGLSNLTETAINIPYEQHLQNTPLQRTDSNHC